MTRKSLFDFGVDLDHDGDKKFLKEFYHCSILESYRTEGEKKRLVTEVFSL